MAALSALPYAPAESLLTIRSFYEDLGNRIWTQYGFVDAFSEQHDWVAQSHLAIDQGPVVVLMENHRSGFYGNYL